MLRWFAMLAGLSLLFTACTTRLNEADDDTAADDDATADDDDATADDDDTAADDDDTGDDDTESPPDYGAPGPYAVTTTADLHSPGGSCTVPFTEFTPAGGPAAPLLVLTHGFMRTEAVLADLAEHFASWGLPVATTGLCHSTILDSDPPADAGDLVAFKQMLGGTDVIYGGHSAGGLRSVLAASADPLTVAVLGLDLVDGDDLALAAAPSLTVPLYGLAGEAGECNSDANGLAVYAAAPSARVLRVTEADHCDFEAPTDWMCTMLCEGNNDQVSDAEIQATIRGLATAYLLWQAGLALEGEHWWTPGEAAYDDLLAAGAITPM
jgi:pimeloyl-ACP methyl ester carboxylesterase